MAKNSFLAHRSSPPRETPQRRAARPLPQHTRAAVGGGISGAAPTAGPPRARAPASTGSWAAGGGGGLLLRRGRLWLFSFTLTLGRRAGGGRRRRRRLRCCRCLLLLCEHRRRGGALGRGYNASKLQVVWNLESGHAPGAEQNCVPAVTERGKKRQKASFEVGIRLFFE